jgi:hypothetical protein
MSALLLALAVELSWELHLALSELALLHSCDRPLAWACMDCWVQLMSGQMGEDRPTTSRFVFRNVMSNITHRIEEENENEGSLGIE